VYAFAGLSQLEKHATWLAAFHTASRRRTMADVSFPSELESILDMLTLRQRKTTTQPDLNAVSDVNINDLDDFVAERILRKTKRQQVTRD
jgi:hypothetical protein